MFQIKSLALIALVAVSSVAAYPQSPVHRSKGADAQVSQAWLMPIVEVTSGQATVQNPNARAVIVDYLINVVQDDGSSMLYNREAVGPAFGTYSDSGPGGTISSANMVIWRVL